MLENSVSIVRHIRDGYYGAHETWRKFRYGVGSLGFGFDEAGPYKSVIGSSESFRDGFILLLHSAAYNLLLSPAAIRIVLSHFQLTSSSYLLSFEYFTLSALLFAVLRSLSDVLDRPRYFFSENMNI